MGATNGTLLAHDPPAALVVGALDMPRVGEPPCSDTCWEARSWLSPHQGSPMFSGAAIWPHIVFVALISIRKVMKLEPAASYSKLTSWMQQKTNSCLL